MNQNEPQKEEQTSVSEAEEAPVPKEKTRPKGLETPEHIEKRHCREAKELIHREKQLMKPRGKGYIAYLFVVLCLAYVVDEMASGIGSQFQTNIVNAFFAPIAGDDYTAGLALLTQVGIIGVAVNLLILLYKPLSDRFGRKPFLAINIFFMALGLFIIYLANNIAVYMIGSIVVGFFIGEDIQVVYILETADKNKRAMAVALCKGAAILGTMLVPILRQFVMKNDDSHWQYVYLGAAIFGLIVSLLALLTARESTAFLNSRITYLRMSDAERNEIRHGTQRQKASQGGVIAGLRFAFSHRQLRNLLIASFFMLFASASTGTYQSVMTEAAGMSTIDVTNSLYYFIIGETVFVMIPGFISDSLGRKKSAVILAVFAIISYSAFFTGSWLKDYPTWLMGLLAGIFVGSFWGSSDTFSSVMVGESTPTNLRASVITVQGIISVSMLLGNLVSSAIANAVHDTAYLGLVYFCFSIPGMVVALTFLLAGVGETKGIDLEKVTGEEWDKPTKKKAITR